MRIIKYENEDCQVLEAFKSPDKNELRIVISDFEDEIQEKRFFDMTINDLETLICDLEHSLEGLR